MIFLAGEVQHEFDVQYSIALLLLVVFSLAGFIAIFFTTFGTLLILAGSLLFSFLTGFRIITIKACGLLVFLYLIGEGFEYLFIILGTKRSGASNAAIVGAIIGAIIGALIGSTFFGVGIFIGTLIGIFMGAFLVELAIKKDLTISIKAGAGGVLGRLGSIAAKVAIALAMFWVTISSVFKNT